MNIQIIAVDIAKDRTWEVATVTYKNLKDNKVTAKKVMSFSLSKDNWELLKNVSKDDILSVDQEKNEKGFWNWTSVARQDGAVGQQAAPASPSSGFSKAPQTRSGGNWETPEERAARQVMIVRQSSISSAVELCKDHGKQPDVQQVIEVARAFEAYVFGNTIADMTNDLVE